MFVLGLGVAIWVSGCLNSNSDADCTDCRLVIGDMGLTLYPVEAEPPFNPGGDDDDDTWGDDDDDTWGDDDDDTWGDDDDDATGGPNCDELESKVACICQEIVNTSGTDYEMCVAGFTVEGLTDTECAYVLSMYPACQ